MPTDAQYMRRCLDLALRGLGPTRSNPIVGSVIVHDDRIIGEGYHEQYGGGHAEVNAVASVAAADRPLLPKASLYVTLEPCFHFGKTPPCVDLILRERIGKVVVALTDPFPAVAGRSLDKLRRAGVTVVTGVLEAEARWAMRRFHTQVEAQRPYVILKWAQSSDGYLGLRGQQVWLTSPAASRVTHRWRSQESAILVGSETVRTDDPALTTRHGYTPSPVRIAVNASGDLPADARVWDGTAPAIWVTAASGLSPKGLPESVTHLPLDAPHDVAALWTALRGHGLKSIIVEGGARVLNAVIASGLWDEARIWTAPRRLNADAQMGIAAPQLAAAPLDTRYIGPDRLDFFANFTPSTTLR